MDEAPRVDRFRVVTWADRPVIHDTFRDVYAVMTDWDTAYRKSKAWSHAWDCGVDVQTAGYSWCITPREATRRG